MTHVEIPAVDYARAKNAAKAVKTRLHDLGNDVCLNHAYECVATSFGFKTWSVLKARLDGEPRQVDVSPRSETQLAELQAKADLGWFDLALGDYNPVVMVHGPAGKKRDSVVGALAGNVSKIVKRLRVINLGAPDRDMAESLIERHHIPGRQKAKPEDVMFFLDPTSPSSSINILDLPLRVTSPSQDHRSRIVAFLAHLTGLSDVSAAQGFLGELVDRTYRTFFDRAPLRFTRGVVPAIDKWCLAAGFSIEEERSWMDIANALVENLQLRLARTAWRQACPRIDHMMFEIRHSRLMDTYGTHEVNGEAMVEIAIRMISTAVRNHAFFRGPTAVDFGSSNELHVVGIDTTKGASQDAVSLLYRLAFDASVAGFGEFEQQTLIAVSGVEAVMGDIKWLMEAAHEEGGPMVVLAAEESGGSVDLDRYVTSHLVVGCSTRASVKDVCDRLKISAGGFETIHDRLFGSFDEDRIEAFGVKRKFVNQREGLVGVSPRRR